MLYSLIIAPIECVVDWVFNFMTNKFSGLGIIGAVCGVSLIINFLALPLYNIADSLQEKERKAAKALEVRVKKIKKAFKGNEQFMMLSTYYRQNDYHPLYVLRSSLSILIEIPFFIAAYHYLSNCEALRGASFWIFKDLGSPDGLLHIGKFPVHVLPIIMTLINFVSGAIYTKEAPFREKIQLYIVAALFLVLLYSSPSGLVIYWILNNLFSLVKNIVMKMKNPGRILHAVLSCIFLAMAFYFFTKEGGSLFKKSVFLLFSLLVAFLPKIKKCLKNVNLFSNHQNTKIDFIILLTSGIGLTLLYGFLIPSSIIATSPSEFSFIGSTDSPLSYVFNSTTIFAGFFIVWPCVIFKMFNEKVSRVESLLFFVLLVLSICNTYIFKAPYGNLNTFLELDSASCLNMGKKIYLLSIVLGIAVVFFAIIIKRNIKANKILSYFIIAVCVGELGVGCLKINYIKKAYNLLAQNKNADKRVEKIEKEYNLSKTGKNVVVLFLDRAIDTFVPKIFAEFQDIAKQFSGFTYYPNTLSFSDFTIQGVPPMLGGYEYTQEQINLRDSELLRDKHNESILLMPKLFSDAGFETTVTDPPWPNYRSSGDLEFFKDYPKINVSEIEGKYFSVFKTEKMMKETNPDKKCKDSFIDFAVLQCLPPFLRGIFNNNARQIDVQQKGDNFFAQLSNLFYLPQMTDFSSKENTFTFIENEATHEVYVSLTNDFESLSKVQTNDNTEMHYQANVAVFKQIGKWLDFLRKNNAFDNTRIIIVSDHGRGINIPLHDQNVAWYSALLMVKDFNSNCSFTTNNEFMTNADTLFIAKKDLPVSNINPFTGKKLIQNKADGVNIYHCIDWNGEHYRNKKTFELDKNRAFHVSENIFDEKNWIPLTEWEKSNGGSK